MIAVTSCKLLIIKGGSSSVVERQLPKLNVAGSIPVSRSNKSTSYAKYLKGKNLKTPLLLL